MTHARPAEVAERDVLVVGGGIAGIEALMALADLGDNRLRLRLVSDRPSFALARDALGVPWGSPLLRVDLERLCRAFGARFELETVTAVDPDAHRVFTSDGDTLEYERLLLTPGARARSGDPSIPTLGFGVLPDTLAGTRSVAVVVADQVTWTLPAYQLALMAAGDGRDVRVVTAEREVLEAFGPGTHSAVRAPLDRHGVVVESRRAPDATIADLADTVVALGLLDGPAIAGLPCDARGFLPVDACAAVRGIADVHAAGDATDHRIKQGGLAAQQADIAATEIVRSCGGDPEPLPFAPVLRGKLTAAGGEELYLLRALDGLDAGRASADALWRPASAICAWRLARWLAFHRTELEQRAGVLEGVDPVTGVATEPQDVLIVGGGIAGLEALMALTDLGDKRLHLRLVSERPTFSLPPDLLGVPWGARPLHIDLDRLCRAFGARFTLATVTDVDADRRQVHTAGGETLPYGRLLLTPGARHALPYTAETRTLGFSVLPHELASDAEGSVAIVVPPGASWTLPAYQLALGCAGYGRDVRVITGERVALETFGPGTHDATRALLDAHGVTVETRSAPETGTTVAGLADTVIALPLLDGPALTGPTLDASGFIRVDARMAVVGVEHVHAAGDATDGELKQGGLAAQQADTAAAEIVRSCGGRIAPTPYTPVLRGKLTAAGGEELYLRRALDGHDEGRTLPDPLWQPANAICAWRLARWLEYHRDELRPFTLDRRPAPAA